jgi:hypothetical protein
MKWFGTVMSDTDTYSFLSKHLSNIARVIIREGKSKYSKASFRIFWPDKTDLMRKRGDLRQSIFDKLFLIRFDDTISPYTFDILKGGKK